MIPFCLRSASRDQDALKDLYNKANELFGAGGDVTLSIVEDLVDMFIEGIVNTRCANSTPLQYERNHGRTCPANGVGRKAIAPKLPGVG